MSDELRLVGAALTAAVIALVLTPLAIRAAVRTDFLDHPVGYKKHSRSTPYLGGLAVLGGFLGASLVLGDDLGDLWPILVIACGLSLLGTADDRVSLGFAIRVILVITAAVGVYVADLGWSYFESEPANLLLTVVFVLGVVNAFNLMDNIDGATTTVGLVASTGIATLAWIEGHIALAVICLAMAGACAGFLPFNLAAPAKIFLGDGGSMLIGFVVAATIMALEGGAQIGWAMVLVAVVLVGLPALDTALVIVSRLRRGAGVFTGSRDHLTHRLLVPLGTPRRVAVVLAGAQALLCSVGIALYEGNQAAAASGALACMLVGAGVIALLETPRWAARLPAASTSGTEPNVSNGSAHLEQTDASKGPSA